MYAVQLQIRLAGDVLLLRRIATMKEEVSDFSPLWPEILKWFVQMEHEQFATEGHGRWPALAPSTVKRRGSSHPILQVTGALAASLTDAGAGWVQVRTPTSIQLGTSLAVKGGWNLGLLHQKGTGRAQTSVGKKGKALKHPTVSFRMPPRPPIDPDWKQKIALRTLFANYIHKIVTGHSFGGGAQTV